MLKYKLTENKNARGLFQIQALRDIPSHGVKCGDFGGYVQSEQNLFQAGDAWVYESAEVCGNAWVYESARVSGDAKVYGDALVCGNAVVTKCLYVQQPLYSITVTNTHVFIGCEGHTWEYWFENIEAIGTKHLYTKNQIQLTKSLLQILQEQIK